MRHTYIPKTWSATSGWTAGQEQIVPAGVVVDANADVQGAIEVAASVEVAANVRVEAALPASRAEMLAAGFSEEVTGDGNTLSALGGVGVTVDNRTIALTSLRALANAESQSTTWQMNLPGAHVDAEMLSHEVAADGSTTSDYLVRVVPEANRTRPAVRVVLVLDTSVSMQLSWSSVVASVGELMASLRADDEIEIVTYARDAQMVSHHASRRDRAQVVQRLSSTRFVSGSNLEGGLRLGLAQASDDKPTVLWLVTDGVPQGGVAEPSELANVIESMPVGAPCQVNVVAFGTSINANTTQAIADAGNGTVVRAPGSDELASAIAGVVHDLTRIAIWNLDLSLQAQANAQIEVLGASHGRALVSADSPPRLLAPVLLQGQEATLRVRIRLPRATTAMLPIATVAATFKNALGAQQSSNVWSVASTALEPNWRLALDLHLKEKLLLVARAIERSDAALVQTTLASHEQYATQLTDNLTLSPDAEISLQARVRSVNDFAEAVFTMLPHAERSERRSLSGRIRAWVDIQF